MLPEPVKTVDEILQELNRGDQAGQWLQMDDLNIMPAALTNEHPVRPNPNIATIVKAFVNTKTGEMRFYLAKALDVPNRENLWR